MGLHCGYGAGDIILDYVNGSNSQASLQKEAGDRETAGEVMMEAEVRVMQRRGHSQRMRATSRS